MIGRSIADRKGEVAAVAGVPLRALLVVLFCLFAQCAYSQFPEGATRLMLGGGSYVISEGGNYVLPDTLNGQVKVSGGTASNPVNIYLADTVVCQCEGGSFCLLGGYTNIIGVGENPVAWLDHPHNFVLSGAEADTVHFTMRNLTIDYHGTGEQNPVYMCTEPPGRSYVYISGCTIKNWVRTSAEGFATGVIVLLCSDAEIADCVITNCQSDRAGAIGLLGSCNVRVTRCSITDNSASLSAGAVFVTTDVSTPGMMQPNYLILEDCLISGNVSREAAVVVDDGLGERVELAGSTKIVGNTASTDGRQSNIFLSEGASLVLDALWNGAAGVWTEEEPTVETPVKVAQAASADGVAGVLPDYSDDVVTYEGGVLWFTKSAPVPPEVPEEPPYGGHYWICEEK